MDRLSAGTPWPLGATVVAGGVNVAVASTHATAIDLCLFDASGRTEVARLPLPGRSADVWHGFLPGATAGLVYGLRAHGPWQPEQGHRFNPQKLLLDPWAREIVDHFAWGTEHQGDDPRDNAATMFKARVVGHDHFDWGDDHPPRTPLADTLIYELHVRGFSRLMPALPQAQRGTYLGLASDAALAHLQRLGVSAVSLLPVHQHLDEQRLVSLGLVNHWGYNTLGFFCPSTRYATRPDGATARDEFRQLVKRLHGAGIEVLLDVVYNHTAESDVHGPHLSWRGLDNASWYRLPPGQRDGYENWAGCGNTLNVDHPRGLQLVLDSLRHWVQHFHVDGFRFDLAPIVGRGERAFERGGAFFKAVQQDPLLSRVKLIAEPWDLGPDGYQLGRFPPGWLEWNDRFRDELRAHWLGHGSTRGALAQRLAGSADLFCSPGRTAAASVNYGVSHDGFTLHDLVSYNERHNQANREDNRDGHAHNLSWNCGAEGDSDDPAVRQRRARLQRALLACVLLAQGTPLLAAGDELGHSQRGNNNPYCQDNRLTWIDWSRADEDLIAYTAHLSALRRRLLPLGTDWYSGRPDKQGRADLAWQLATGGPLTAADWQDGQARTLQLAIGRPGRSGPPLQLLLNAEAEDHTFLLPPGDWQLQLDSSQPQGQRDWQGSGSMGVAAHSVLLLQAVNGT